MSQFTYCTRRGCVNRAEKSFTNSTRMIVNVCDDHEYEVAELMAEMSAAIGRSQDRPRVAERLITPRLPERRRDPDPLPSIAEMGLRGYLNPPRLLPAKRPAPIASAGAMEVSVASAGPATPIAPAGRVTPLKLQQFLQSIIDGRPQKRIERSDSSHVCVYIYPDACDHPGCATPGQYAINVVGTRTSAPRYCMNHAAANLYPPT